MKYVAPSSDSFEEKGAHYEEKGVWYIRLKQSYYFIITLLYKQEMTQRGRARLTAPVKVYCQNMRQLPTVQAPVTC